jgi:hypothetical protein
MQNCYDPYLDEKIFEIIENNNKNETQFNKLVKLLDKTPRTISKHLEFLTNKQKILQWQKNAPGKKGSIKFMNKAMIKKRYGLLTVDYKDKRGICKEWKRKNEIEKTKNMKNKTILFLLIAFAYGYTGYKLTSEPLPGGTAIRDNKGRFIDVFLYSEKGFSIEDLDKEDFQFSAIHSILRLNNRFTKSEIREMFEELKKHKDIILKPAIGSDGKEVRYDIEDDVLKELLIWCFNILRNFVSMMIQYWFILGIKPKREEAQWFNFVVGEKAAIDLFTKIDKNRVEKKTIRELYIEYRFKDTILDKKMIDRDLEDREAYYREKYHLDIFTQKGMEEYIFTQSNESIILNNHCNLIAGNFEDPKKYNKYDEKYQKLINTKKYQWIMEELLNIINPPFSRRRYQVKLT